MKVLKDKSKTLLVFSPPSSVPSLFKALHENRSPITSPESVVYFTV